MFAYMAKDIFTNVKETTKRLAKKLMYGFIWNQVTGGQDIPKEQRGELNQRKLALVSYLYKKEGTL